MTAHDVHTNLHTGRVPAPPDPRNLRFAAYTTPELPSPPKRVDWLSKVAAWPMFGNDRVGDCEVAAAAHGEQAFSAYGVGREYDMTDADVLTAYSAISGYDPRTGANDNGTTTLDLLNYWRRNGIGGRRITAYVEVDVHNRDEVKRALAVGGVLHIGADLPLAAGDQFGAGKHWSVTRGDRGKAGSWGGHAIHVGAYDNRYLTCITWARKQRMTWSWFDHYVVEAFVPINPDWFNQAGQSPTGLDVAALTADLQRITSG